MLQSMNPGETFYRDNILLSILNILRNHVIKKWSKRSLSIRGAYAIVFCHQNHYFVYEFL